MQNFAPNLGFLFSGRFGRLDSLTGTGSFVVSTCSGFTSRNAAFRDLMSVSQSGGSLRRRPGHDTKRMSGESKSKGSRKGKGKKEKSSKKGKRKDDGDEKAMDTSAEEKAARAPDSMGSIANMPLMDNEIHRQYTAEKAALPKAIKGLRACLKCKLVKTGEQFASDGCDNCPDHDPERHTTPVFTGSVCRCRAASRRPLGPFLLPGWWVCISLPGVGSRSSSAKVPVSMSFVFFV